MNLKILWLTSDFPVHPEIGRNLYLWHPLEALMQAGVKSIVLNVQGWKPGNKKVIEKQYFPIEIKQKSYCSIPRHYLRTVSNYFFLKTIVPMIEKLHQLHGFDVIHAHGEINGLAAMEAGKRLNIPSVVTLHGIEMCPRMWKGHSGKIFTMMLNKAHKIIYVGEPLQKHFSNVINDDKQGCIVHNGFRIPTDQQLTHVILKNSTIIRLTSVSLLQEGKGIDLTIAALAQLRKQGIENWAYCIIGNGPQKKYLKKLVEKLGLKEKIQFVDECTHHEVYNHLQNSDIFCLPSYREAFGIVYAEAMANGLLTIGVKKQGAAALIEHGKTGLLVEPRDINSLAAVLKAAMRNVEAMQKIAIAGREHVLAHFTWEKHAEKLLALYKNIVLM